jgi:uncharacterized protein (TIGR02594 family)
MNVSNAFRRPGALTAVAVCSLAIVAVATPASARPHHGASRHSHAHHANHHISRHHRYRHVRYGRARHAALSENQAPENTGGFGVVSDVVAEARRYIGGNPTGRSSLWCARFMNFVLQRSGHTGTGSDMARSFASYGHRVSGPQVGAIAVMSRRGGGHVGVVSGVDEKGNPIIISGNHGHRVAEATYARGRVYAYVMPSS